LDLWCDKSQGITVGAFAKEGDERMANEIIIKGQKAKRGERMTKGSGWRLARRGGASVFLQVPYLQQLIAEKNVSLSLASQSRLRFRGLTALQISWRNQTRHLRSMLLGSNGVTAHLIVGEPAAQLGRRRLTHCLISNRHGVAAFSRLAAQMVVSPYRRKGTFCSHLLSAAKTADCG
jgi:hypothetical protein